MVLGEGVWVLVLERWPEKNLARWVAFDRDGSAMMIEMWGLKSLDVGIELLTIYGSKCFGSSEGIPYVVGLRPYRCEKRRKLTEAPL